MGEIYKLSGKDINNELINLRQVTFEVTDACNLKCKYCGYGELYEGHDAREDKYLPVEKAKMVIDYLVELWKQSSTDKFYHSVAFSFYGGEPLLNFNLIKEIISYAEQQVTNRAIHYSMTTNAMLLNRYMDFLVEKKFRLLISLDGDEQAHSYRIDHSGHNSFDRVFNNVKLLKDTYPDYFAEFVNFNSVFTDRSEVERIHKFIHNNFGKSSTITELNNSGIKQDKINEYELMSNKITESINRSECYEKLSEQMFLSDPYVDRLSKFTQRISGNYFMDYNNLLFDSEKFTRIPTGTCLPFQKRMFVTVNGKIIQCERIDQKYALGEVTDHGVKLDLDEIANRYNERIESIQHLCKSCAGEKICSQCIYYIDNLGQKNIKCKGYMTKERFEEYKQSNINYLRRFPHLYKKLMEDVLIDY